jgi:hypothetical protein
MSDGLKEKLERWLPPVPEKSSPVQIAAVAVALRRRIEKENWGDHEPAKEIAFSCLDVIIGGMYMQTASPAERSKYLARESALQEKFNNDPAYADMKPFDRKLQFNKVSTSGKREFINRARNLAPVKDVTYLTLKLKFDGLDTAGAPYIKMMTEEMDFLALALNSAGSALYRKDATNRSSPPDGPRSLQELYACGQAYIYGYNVREKWPDMDALADMNTPAIERSHQSVLLLMQQLERMQSDLPEAEVRARIRANFQHIREVFKTRFIGLLDVAALTHFYLEHNEDKLGAKDYAALLNSLGVMQFCDFQEVNSKIRYFRELPEEQYEAAFNAAKALYYVEYKKPSADEVAQDIRAKIRSAYQGNPRSADKNIRGFDETRAARPEGMEEVVLLHYEESEQIRDLRKKMFKSQKERFIKTLATENVDELEALGLSAEQIAGMAETGKIPEGSGLTVEHIIDRHHGGTNQLHNFILMPREINEAKNELKRYQTNAAQDPDKGCWIVSWVPKKNADGAYPKVFNPSRSESSSPLPELAGMEIP